MKQAGLVVIMTLILVTMLGALKAGVNEPRVERLDAFHVMGMQLKDSLDSAKLTQLWIDYYRNNSKIPEPIPGAEYGIKYFGKDFDPNTMRGFYYLVGTQVKAPVSAPEPLRVRTVPSATYLVFEHRGPLSRINNTYSEIFNQYFPKSKYTPAPQDVFEKYDTRYKLDAEDSILEIWVPVNL